MKKKDNKSETGLLRYLFVSIVTHIVIIYILTNFVGEKPVFQIYPLEYYSEVQVLHYDEQAEADQSEIDQDLVKEADLEVEDETIEEEEVEVEEEPKEVKEDREVSESEELVEVAEEEVVEEFEEEGTELEEDVLTSEVSEEEIKVSEEIEDEEIEDEEIEDEEIEDEEIEDEEIEDEEIEDEEIEDEEIEDEEIEDEEIEDEEVAPPPPAARDFIATKITPSYPKDAANLAQEGTVRLLVTIKSNGEVKDVEILDSAENSQFNNVAELTVERGWIFKPAESDYQIELVVDFKYTDQQSNVELEFIDLFFVEE
ncbi:energy transducer TonB [Natroniella acetigena]|uniref:energy transducer TonB n=1 Tax=Natroniella acetigena TaxID=52004 RepID=UPI00200A1402|nr:energy transducer TonB [Natroniella acetigena]MCK8827950.1 energy transducer TonB [Natroniella acetigena]